MGGSDLDRAEEAEGQETNRDRRGRRSEDEDAETEERRPEAEMGGSAELVTSIDDNRCRDWESNERIKDKSPSRQICATRPKKYVKECETNGEKYSPDMEIETPRPDLKKERVEEEDEKFVLEVSNEPEEVGMNQRASSPEICNSV